MKKIGLLFVFLVLGIFSFGQVNFAVEIQIEGRGIAIADQLSLSDITWSMRNLNTGATILGTEALYKTLLHDGNNTQAIMVDVNEFAAKGGLHVGDDREFTVIINSGKYAGYSGSVVCHYAVAGSADFLGNDGINATLGDALNNFMYGLPFNKINIKTFTDGIFNIACTRKAFDCLSI